MDSNRQQYLIDKLRVKIIQERSSNKSPSGSTLKSQKFFPNLHKRSTTDTHFKPDPITRDVSHQLDSISKVKSNSQLQEIKLREILGKKPKQKKLPRDLKELEKAVEKKFLKKGKKQLFSELEAMKLKISKQKEKLLKQVVDEGGLLYRTQSGLILPQLTGMYESLLKKVKNVQVDLPRSDLDLGNPSGRKEVGIIIAWLENMIQAFVNEPSDLTLEEKVRRASMIYTVCFKEVVRQVTNHCIERGILLQKIWNAQIDIYCAKEDENVKKIEEFQKRILEVLKSCKEKYERKLKDLENGNEKLKEKVEEKDKEILALRNKVEEIKTQNDKDRHSLIMSFTKFSGVKEPGEREEAVLYLVEKNIQAGVPVVMVGYFDVNGGFHKNRVVQNAGKKVVEQDIDQIIPIFEMKSEYTDLCDFQEYLSKFKEIKEVSNQIPETLNLSVCYESQFTYLVTKIKRTKNSKSRKSENIYRASLKVPVNKPRSTSLYLDNSKPSKKKSRLHRKSSKKLNKSNFDSLNVSNSFKIVESKVKTPTNFKKNKIFKKFLDEKIQKLKQDKIDSEYKRDSTNLSVKSQRLSKDSKKSLKRISLDESIDESYEESSINSSNNSEIDIESSEEDSINKKALKKKPKNKSLDRPRIRGLSNILSSPFKKEEGLNSKSKKSVKLSLDSNQNLDLELKHIINSSKNTISVKPRYTILKTPPLSGTSSEDEIPKRSKRVSITENPKLRSSLLSEEKKIVGQAENFKGLESVEIKSKGKKNQKNKRSSGLTEKSLEYSQESDQNSGPIENSQKSSKDPGRSSQFSIFQQLKDAEDTPILSLDLIERLKNLKSADELSNIFKTFLPQAFKSAECSEKITQTEEEAPVLSFKLEIPENIFPVSKTPGTRSRRKSFTKIPNSITSPKNKSASVYNSLNNSQKLKTKEKHKKASTPSEEFILGLILKKIVINHPGQKLFHSILPSLSNTLTQPKLSLKSLMKIINLVYQNKLTLIKENSAYYKYETCMILYDILMKKYGLKNVAEGHFLQVLKATVYYQSKYLRVSNFSRFLGSIQSGIEVEDWNFYIIALDLIDNFSYGKNSNNEETTHEQFCAYGAAVQVIHNLFETKLAEDHLEDLLKNVNKLKIEQNQSVSKRTSAQRIIENVNIDEFLNECLGTYAELKEKIKEKFWPGLANEEMITETEFIEQSKILKFPETESLQKLFEKYAVVQKLDDDKVQKALKIRNFCALVFENSQLDYKDYYKKQ